MIIPLVSSVPHFLRNSRALLTIPCLALVLACSVSAPRWQQATNVECLVWNAQPDPADTVTWTGPCVAGKAHGAGTEVFRYRDHGTLKEQRYVGTMTAGKLQGHGTLYFDNGDQFEGEFSDGSRVHGLYTRPNGDRYEAGTRLNHRRAARRRPVTSNVRPRTCDGLRYAYYMHIMLHAEQLRSSEGCGESAQARHLPH